MRVSDVVFYSVKAMRERRLRTMLTLLGIIIGPATMVSLSSMMLGFSQSINDQIAKLGAVTLLVVPSSGNKLTVDDAEVIAGLDHVVRAIPFYTFTGFVEEGPDSVRAINVFAIDLEDLMKIVEGMRVGGGEVPEPSDIGSAVAGFLVANPEDPRETPYRVGDTLMLRIPVDLGSRPKYEIRSFVIVGVLEEFGPAFFLNPDSAIFVSFETGRSLKASDEVSGIVVQAESVDLVDRVEEEIKNLYAGSVEIYSIKVLLNVVNNILSSINSLMISVASVSLLVAFVGIMTTMFTAVVERTREIGLLKALGYTNNEVMLLFLSESGITGLVGGLLGSALGVVVAYARSLLVRPQEIAGGLFSITRITPIFTLENIVFAVALAFIVGLVAGAIPAYRASRMEPVKALRYE